MTKTQTHAKTRITRDEARRLSLTPEQFLEMIGYEFRGGKWVQVSGEGVVLVGTDPLVAFCPGGNLPAPTGDEVMEPMNELAALPFWTVKALLRDYHPDGPNKSHCSYATAYREFVQNDNPHVLTVAELDQMGSDYDALTPAALNTGITVAGIREGILCPRSNGILMVWPGEHAGQKGRDSQFHPLLNISLWDFVHPKGWLYPNVEEFGGFYAVLGIQKGDNHFHGAIQLWGQKRRGVKKVKVMVNTALVTEFCVEETSFQGQSLGYTVVNAIDAMRPFDPQAEEEAFARMWNAKQYFVTNEVLVKVALMLSQAIY